MKSYSAYAFLFCSKRLTLFGFTTNQKIHTVSNEYVITCVNFGSQTWKFLLFRVLFSRLLQNRKAEYNDQSSSIALPLG